VRIEQTDIAGLALLHWQVNRDERGSFARSFCREALAEAGLSFDVTQTNVSRSPMAGTLRGLHYQRAPHQEAKILTCVRGRIWDVAVDIRPGSPMLGRWLAFELGPDSNFGIHVPAGCAHGFLTLEADTEVHYLMDGAYAADAAAGIRWDDPALGISWPMAPALISGRDRNLPLFGAAA
jgi:dTDP-4-dehydrorhamnose 3,5-epimerase